MKKQFTMYPIIASYDHQTSGEFEIVYYNDANLPQTEWMLAHGDRDLVEQITRLVDEGYCISRVTRRR